MLVDAGCAYVVKGEKWLGLGANTTVFVMEEGDMIGICTKKAREEKEKIRVA